MQIFQMEPEVSILTMIYLDRFSELSRVPFNNDTWRRLVFTALIVASKVWEESPFENEEITQISRHHSPDELVAMERAFVRTLEFNLSVHDAEYAKIHALLHVRSTSSGLADTVQPGLDSTRSGQLKERCVRMQATSRQCYSESSQDCADKHEVYSWSTD